MIDVDQARGPQLGRFGWYEKETLMPTGQGLISSGFRTLSLATIAAALVFTTSETSVVAAPAAPVSTDISRTVGSSGATDFSAARRYRHYHHRRNAAGAAFAGMAFGMIAGAIAAQQRQEYYENYGYYYGPAHYYGPGYYYGGPSYYGRRYYYPPY